MPNPRHVAAQLDPPPSYAELLAASQAGMSLVAWRAAGKPLATTAKTGTDRTPKLRPWHPYRSKWEAVYATHLDARKQLGDRVSPIVEDWEYEPERLEIGVGAFYTPDFRVKLRLGTQRWVEWREVKGYRREAAIVRIKAAALRYPDKTFVLVTKVGGEWVHQTIGAP